MLMFITYISTLTFDELQLECEKYCSEALI